MTNGNRYDVNLVQRTRTPVYWADEPNEVRRSKWFYLTERESRFFPFDEQMNDTLEVETSTSSRFQPSMIFTLVEYVHRHVSQSFVAYEA